MKRQPTLKLTSLAFGLLICLSAAAQSSYDDYYLADKTFKLQEDFDGSSTLWDTDEPGIRTAKIVDGYLDFRSLNDKTQVKYRTIDIDWSGNWELEIGVTWDGGKETSAVDFIWDKESGNSNKFHFGFTGSGKYVISEYKNSTYNHIAQFIPASYVYKNSRNRLTVRKVGQKYYLFFNEILVKTMDYKPVKGDLIGITVPPGSRIMVDYIYAFELKSRSTSTRSTDTSSTSDLSSSIDNSGGFVGVMTKGNGYNLQRWKTRENFPKDAIKQDWDDGYSISDVSYDNDKWTLVMSKGTGYATQQWKTRYEFPKDDIKELWEESYKITELNYGNGVWALVMSKNSGLGRQRWSTRSEFPTEKIKEFGDEGLYISELVYGKDRWALVSTNDNDIRGQRWTKAYDFPYDKIRTNSSDGYTITQLSYEKDAWILIMTKYNDSRSHVWFNTKEFPKSKIKEYWDKGYYLTDLTHKAATLSNNSISTSSTKSTTISLKSKLLGKWYGGSEGEPQGNMTFFSDGMLKIVSQGETVGGYSYEQDGIKIDVKYELNSVETPNQLDIVFYSSGKSLGSMKGIIRFKDSDTFEFKINSVLNDPRPSSFTNTADSKVATFKRMN